MGLAFGTATAVLQFCTAVSNNVGVDDELKERADDLSSKVGTLLSQLNELAAQNHELRKEVLDIREEHTKLQKQFDEVGRYQRVELYPRGPVVFGLKPGMERPG